MSNKLIFGLLGLSLLFGCQQESRLAETTNGVNQVGLHAKGVAADYILGQLSPKATASAQRNAGGMYRPAGVVVINGNLFVAESTNQRILGFKDASTLANAESADLVIGQGDFFTDDETGIPTNPDKSIGSPTFLAADSQNRLYVLGTAGVQVFEDPFANDTIWDYELFDLPTTLRSIRVLANDRVAVIGRDLIRIYQAGATTPIAQGDISSVGSCNNAFEDLVELRGSSANAFLVSCGTNGIFAIAIDSNTGLPIDPTGFLYPDDVVFRPNGGSFQNLFFISNYLFVSDRSGERVLRLGNVESTVTTVFGDAPGNDSSILVNASTPTFGQDDGATFDGSNQGELSPTAFTVYTPVQTFVQSNGRLWLADANNHRVLALDGSLATTWNVQADLVLGQPDFTHNKGNRLEPAALVAPYGVALYDNGTTLELYVADSGNNRVLVWNDVTDLDKDPDKVLGQASGLDYLPNRDGTFNGLDGPPTDSNDEFNLPRYIAIASNGTVYVADANNQRILGFPRNATTANQVYGALNFQSAGSFSLNAGLAVSDGFIFVGEGNRVLRFARITNGAQHYPDLVFGQQPTDPPESTGNACNWIGSVRSDTLCTVQGVALDSQGNLWVSDAGNGRVLWFEDPGAAVANITDIITADGVVGQVDLLSSVTGSLSGRFINPRGLAVDVQGVLWVADDGNYRVVAFPTPMVPDLKTGLAQPETVLGQKACDLAATAQNPSAWSLYYPTNLAVDASGKVVLVSDTTNNRVMRFIDNGAPVISGGGDYEIPSGETLTVNLSVTDPDGDATSELKLLDPVPEGGSLTGGTFTYSAVDKEAGTTAKFIIYVEDLGPKSQSSTTTLLVHVVERIPTAVTPTQPSERKAKAAADSCMCGSVDASWQAFGALLVLGWIRRRRS